MKTFPPFFLQGNLIIFRVDFQRQIYLPMSVQQCYEIFFHVVKPSSDSDQLVKNEISMDDYIVYSHLVRLGYIVRRHYKQPDSGQEPRGQPMATGQDLPDFETTPLIQSDQLGRLKLSSIMKTLDFIPSLSIAVLKQKLTTPKRPPEFHVLFDIHAPSKTFKKSKPLEPVYQLLTRIDGRERRKIPDLGELVRNRETPWPDAKSQHLYAFVNENGEFSFYNFDFKSLPVINELD